MGDSIRPGDYAVQISIYNDNIYDEFIWYYYLHGGKVHILDERNFPEDRSVIGVKLNRFRFTSPDYPDDFAIVGNLF